MAINQSFVNLTQKLCQVEQQPEAHAESTPMGCPGGEGGQAGPSTSEGTREVRSKRKQEVKGNRTFWKNQSPAAMKKAFKIMPTLTLATQRETKMMRIAMVLEMISIHHKLTQELLRGKVMTSSIAYASFSLFF